MTIEATGVVSRTGHARWLVTEYDLYLIWRYILTFATGGHFRFIDRYFGESERGGSEDTDAIRGTLVDLMASRSLKANWPWSAICDLVTAIAKRRLSINPSRDMRIEAATLSDLAAIRAVYAGAREIQREQGAVPWPEFVPELTIAEIEAGRSFRVMDGGMLAGVFSVAYEDEAIWGERERGEHIYLHRIARSVTHPGRGIVGAVLEWAWAECRRLGRVGLRLDTWGSNQALIQFYERQGFRFVGLQRIGIEPRLAPHYQGIELALLEATGEGGGSIPT